VLEHGASLNVSVLKGTLLSCLVLLLLAGPYQHGNIRISMPIALA
jgi:hypothetical protein